MINFAQGQAAGDAGLLQNALRQAGREISKEDQKALDEAIAADPGLRMQFLSGRLRGELARALDEGGPAQREVTLRQLDIAHDIHKRMYQCINARNEASPGIPATVELYGPPQRVNGTQSEAAAELAVPTRPSLGQMLQGPQRDRLLTVLRKPGTKLSIQRPVPGGGKVRVDLKLAVPDGASDAQIQDALERISSNGLLARVGDTGPWRPVSDVPELRGWKPSEKTGIILP